jgi:uncharacterized protein (TIGR02246 family)
MPYSTHRPYYKIFVIIACALLLLCPRQSQAQSSEDIAQIKELVDAYANARDGNNEDQIRALFTPDADQLVSSGEWRDGIDALVEGMMRSSRSNPGDRTLTVEKVRFLGLETALADARYEIKGSQGVPDRKMWSTFVVRKEQNHWKIAAIRNMLPSPPR